jgi:hypothetical protein
MAQTIRRQPLSTEVPIHTQNSICGICRSQCGTGTRFSLESFGFPVPVWLHQCSILNIVLILPEGQSVAAWESSDKATIFRKSWSIGQKSAFKFFYFSVEVCQSFSLLQCLLSVCLSVSVSLSGYYITLFIYLSKVYLTMASVSASHYIHTISQLFQPMRLIFAFELRPKLLLTTQGGLSHLPRQTITHTAVW